METIMATIDWCDKNFAAVVEGVCGIVVVTNKTMKGLKEDLSQALEKHFELLEQEEKEPWMVAGGYTLKYDYTMSAILQEALNFTTLAAISRVTGIKHAQLSHYANAVSRPKEAQKTRIISGLHEIGNACLAVR